MKLLAGIVGLSSLLGEQDAKLSESFEDGKKDANEKGKEEEDRNRDNDKDKEQGKYQDNLTNRDFNRQSEATVDTNPQRALQSTQSYRKEKFGCDCLTVFLVLWICLAIWVIAFTIRMLSEQILEAGQEGRR